MASCGRADCLFLVPELVPDILGAPEAVAGVYLTGRIVAYWTRLAEQVAGNKP